MSHMRNYFSWNMINRVITGFSHDFKCCWVLHIKTGAIIVALVFMGFQAILFCAVSTLAIKNANFVNESDYEVMEDPLKQAHERTLSWHKGSAFDADDAFITLITMGICVLLTAVLIFGVLTNQARLLTPFLCMQMFDFVFSAFATTGTWTNMGNFRKLLLTQPVFPYREQLMKMNVNLLTFLFVIVSVTFLIIKIYMMCVVWTCYHYISRNPGFLRSSAAISSNSRSPRNVFNSPPFDSSLPIIPEEQPINIDLTILPPKYEEVILMPPPATQSETPPPPYSAL